MPADGLVVQLGTVVYVRDTDSLAFVVAKDKSSSHVTIRYKCTQTVSAVHANALRKAYALGVPKTSLAKVPIRPGDSPRSALALLIAKGCVDSRTTYALYAGEEPSHTAAPTWRCFLYVPNRAFAKMHDEMMMSDNGGELCGVRVYLSTHDQTSPGAKFYFGTQCLDAAVQDASPWYVDVRADVVRALTQRFASQHGATADASNINAVANLNDVLDA